ncbi:MAG: PDZ domain-containing protein [Calditrichaceae bacterium]
MTRNLLYLFIFVIFVQSVQADWDKKVKKIEDKVVIIEYFEQIISTEAIVEKERVKKQITGIIVNDSGLVMTSSSIFKANLEFTSAVSMMDQSAKPSDIRVKFHDGRSFPAEFIGKDDDKELAFIRIVNAGDIKPIRFKKKSDLKLGSEILIIQHLSEDFDYEFVVYPRRINAVIPKSYKKYLCENNVKALSHFGLVLNNDGEPVGILNSENNIPQMSFDIPEYLLNQPIEIVAYETFANLIANPPVYKEKETARKKWLGIYMQPFNREMAAFYNHDKLKGVLVNTVITDSPADKAGLQVGDVITKVGDTKVSAEKDSDLEGFRKLIREQKDSNVIFEVFRDSVFLNLKVHLGDTPISQYLADEVSDETLGLSVKELTQDIILAKQLDWETEGVWVSKVERAGWVDVAGLQVGDLILKINDQPVSNLDSVRQIFKQIEKNKPGYLSFFIRRNSGTLFLFVKTNFDESDES